MLLWWIGPLLAVLIALIYFLLLRPQLEEREELKEFFASCDSFYSALWARIRGGWLMITSTVLLILPEIPVFINELQLVDLSMILPPDWARVATKLLAIAGLITRFYVGVTMPKQEPR